MSLGLKCTLIMPVNKMFRLDRGVLVLKKITSISRNYTKPSYHHNVGKEPLRALTMGQLLEESCQKFGNNYAVISRSQNRRITFQETLEEADRLAAGFLKMGFIPGDRLGIWAPNMAEWYVASMAGARAGFVMVCLNPAYQSKEIEYCIKKVGIKGIVCTDTLKKQNYYELIHNVCKELPDSEPGKIKSENLPTLKSVVFISGEKFKGALNYNDILNVADSDHIDLVKKNQSKIKIDDPCNIQLTSGTTGKPKAAVISHFSMVNNGFYIGRRNELHKKQHKICVQIPFFHAFGTIISISGALNYGATLVLPALSYNPEKNLDTLKEEKCSMIFGTPTMYVDLVNAQKQRQEKIYAEIALSGGASCSPHLFKNMLNVLGIKKVKSIYGLSETTAGAYQSLENDVEYEAVSTVGYLHDHLEAKVVDENGNVVPMGTPGELCLRGYTTMLGYWGDQQKTDEIIEPSRWLHTGDQFVMEESGYGRVVGRLKEMIIRGGENIYPREIEDYLNTHPDVLDTQVIGLPHERLGEEVCACIRVKDNNQLTLDDIKKFCKGNISHFKVPTVLRIFDSFPKTTSGKIQKFKLLEQVVAER